MDVTEELIYLNRRKFLKGVTALGLLPLTSSAESAVTPQNFVSNHCNYFEFSTNKEVVKILAKSLTLSPWSVKVDGLVESPIELDIKSLSANLNTVERVYPLRCVEGWVATIPWSGFELGKLLNLAKPLPTAKYVKFVGTHRPEEMINQRSPRLPWPYTEGLRLDEAMHPLSIIATGMYGADLTPENGAPVRLVVPWKYGFKSIKAIQRIELTDSIPLGSWQQKAPQEYGFYANVNPDVAHPRWSQRRELPLGQLKKRRTKPFNGYADEVADLYHGMDLTEHF